MAELDALISEVRMLRKMVEKMAAASPPPRVPVLLREAAAVCHVDKAWLLERVQMKDIVGYRATDEAPWRVYVDDVLAYLTRKASITPADRQQARKLRALVG